MSKKYSIGLLGIVILLAVFFGIKFYGAVSFKGLKAPLGKSEVNISNTEKLPLNLPAGFSASIYAKDLGGPRVLSYDPAGRMIVSVPGDGKVIALTDKDGDGFAETHNIVALGLTQPHGLAHKCDGTACRLFIAETNQVSQYDWDTDNSKAINKKKLFDLPGGGNHVTRTILVAPYPNEDKMLVSVGSSCNVCHEADEMRAKVLEYDFSTGKLETFARGLRNSVFMSIHPVSGEIWATEMGRDLLGDNIPPDEVNIIKKGGNYGWPICYGKNIHDDVFDKNVYIRNPCLEPLESPSTIDIQAHSAPLGLAFFPEEGWPEEYWYNMLVAYHGSWNRTEPTGYKIVRYKLDQAGNVLGQEDFLTGWLGEDGIAWGRPVDILIQPGGKIFISDDKAGVIYKVNYQQ